MTVTPDKDCSTGCISKLWLRSQEPLYVRDPADSVKAPAPTSKEMHPLSADEARKLLEAEQGDRLEALYVLAIHTSMRRGELLGLKWSDVHLDDRTVRVRVRRTLTAPTTASATPSESRRPGKVAAPSGSLRGP